MWVLPQGQFENSSGPWSMHTTPPKGMKSLAMTRIHVKASSELLLEVFVRHTHLTASEINKQCVALISLLLLLTSGTYWVADDLKNKWSHLPRSFIQEVRLMDYQVSLIPPCIPLGKCWLKE